MHLTRFALLTALVACLAAVPASATLFIFDGSASFNRSGDLAWPANNAGDGTYINLTDPVLADLSLSSFNLVNPGDTATVLLGTLAMSSGNVNTTNEVAARSFTVGFTLTGLSTVSFTIDGGPGQQVGAIPYVGGDTTDSVTNETDAWDVRFDFTGESQDINFGTTGVLRAVLVDDNGSPIVSFNYNGDPEGIRALFTLIEADSAVPEPATYVLIASALAGLAFLRRRAR